MNVLDAMRYLVALDEHRHFGRAAQACRITQPALSNAVRSLEAAFGIVIVRRGPQFLGLTPEGRTVLASAHRLLHEYEALRQELGREQFAPRGSLVIGAVPTAVPIALTFAARLRLCHPGIVPSVRSLSNAEIETGVTTLGLDLAFGYADPAAPRRERTLVIPQYVERYFLLRRRGEAPPAGRRRRTVRWRDAVALPLCLLTAETHNRSVIDQAFARAGVQVAPAIETNAVMMLVLAALAGDVCSVVPGALLSIASRYEELEALPLVQPACESGVAVLISRQARRSLAQQAAVELAADAQWLATAAAQSGPSPGRSTVDADRRTRSAREAKAGKARTHSKSE